MKSHRIKLEGDSRAKASRAQQRCCLFLVHKDSTWRGLCVCLCVGHNRQLCRLFTQTVDWAQYALGGLAPLIDNTQRPILMASWFDNNTCTRVAMLTNRLPTGQPCCSSCIRVNISRDVLSPVSQTTLTLVTESNVN